MPTIRSWTRVRVTLTTSARVFLADFAHGFMVVSHNSLAACGLMVLTTLVVLGSRADVRTSLEDSALDWLLARQESRLQDVPDADEALIEVSAIDRATAADPARLNRQQAAVAQWLSRRYRVAPEPVSALVQEAWALGTKVKLEPTLILAIMAIESSFNPFAQSPMGAQGLMQVMTTVHDDKYQPFGGNHAAFDPVTNLRVGVAVLKECIARAGGSLEGGLRLYVGAGALPDDSGYAGKVMAEEHHLRQVALGRPVPVTVKLPAPPAPQARPAAPPAPDTAAAPAKPATTLAAAVERLVAPRHAAAAPPPEGASAAQEQLALLR